MFPAGIESTVPASERPQSHSLDRVATGKTSALEYWNKESYLCRKLNDTAYLFIQLYLIVSLITVAAELNALCGGKWEGVAEC